MNNERFEQLLSSVREAGAIARGKVEPPRVFRIEVTDIPSVPDETWAICVDSDDHTLLIPRKLYRVKFVSGGVWVRDENGEMTSCDTEDFVPVAFDSEVSDLLAKAA